MSRITIEQLIKFVIDNTIFSEEESVNKMVKEIDNKPVIHLPENLKKIFLSYLPTISNFKFNSLNNRKNHTLYYSLAACLKDDFILLPADGQLVFVKQMVEKIIIDLAARKFKFKISLKKSDVIENLKQYNTSNEMIALLSTYFNVNIFILSYKEDKLFAIYKEDAFNQFKMNIFLINIDETFEVLLYKNSKLWDYKNIQALVSSANVHIPNDLKKGKLKDKKFEIHEEDISIYENNKPDDVKKDLTENNNEKIKNKANEYSEVDSRALNGSGKAETVDNDDVISDIEDEENDIVTQIKNNDTKDKTNVFYRSDEIKSIVPATNAKPNSQTVPGKPENVNIKMKLEEIQNIAQKLNITITNKNSKTKTKRELIDEITINKH